MEREFRFRAWHNETEQMLFVGDSFGTKHPLDCVNYARQGQDVVLMQYVGLKDKNGTPIFEGDVIRAEFGHTHTNMQVMHTLDWDGSKDHFNNPFMSAWGATDGHYFCCFMNVYDPTKYAEVIGNIYQNPELINKATS